MAKLFANSGDPVQMPHSAASDLGLHCLPITLLRVSRLQWVKMPLPIPNVTKKNKQRTCYRSVFGDNSGIMFFLFHKNICYGYSFEVPLWGTFNEYPQHMLSWRNKKNISLDALLICVWFSDIQWFGDIQWFSDIQDMFFGYTSNLK